MKKKIVALLIAACVGCVSMTACSNGIGSIANERMNNVETNASLSEEDQLKDMMEQVINAGSSTAQKEETVYVMTDAYGAAKEIIVSDWLKNTENTEKLEDVSDLKDIVNVKGSEDYIVEGDHLEWNANGKDIYYQGTTDKELPVEMKVTYLLDGNEMTAEEIKGKSGHVEIILNYENHATKKVEIDGKEEDIYVPFAVISGMRLNNEKFTNVSVSNGTVISDGNGCMVAGMAFPGLVDSLNGGKVEDSKLLNQLEEKMDIPGEVIVEADVKDFDFGMILTMVSSNVFSALGFDNVEEGIDVSELQDSMAEFKDAGAELSEGTEKLKDGVKELSTGTGSLVTGSGELYDGVVKYTDGVNQVANGAAALDSGAGQVESGVSSLQNGIGQLDAGAGALKAGVDQVNQGSTALKNGTNQLSQGAENLTAGATLVSDGVNAVVAQMGTISEGVGEAVGAAQLVSGGLNRVVEATEVTTTLEDADIQAIVVSGIVDESTAAQVIWGNVPQEALEAMGLTAEQIAGLQQVISQVAGQAVPAMVDQAATGAARQAAVQTANSVKGQIGAAITTSGAEGSPSLQEGAVLLAQSLANSYGQMTAEPAVMQLQALSTGALAVAQGAQELYTGIVTVDQGMDGLCAGAAQLSQGAAALKEGTEKASSGAGELKNGVSQLKNGAYSLASGANELTTNSASLVAGSKALAEGAVTLTGGVSELLTGANKLNDGMTQFNEEGIGEITSLLDTDVNVMNKRIQALAQAAKEYNSFSTCKEGMDSSVKFIMETSFSK